MRGQGACPAGTSRHGLVAPALTSCDLSGQEPASCHLQGSHHARLSPVSPEVALPQPLHTAEGAGGWASAPLSKESSWVCRMVEMLSTLATGCTRFPIVETQGYDDL